MTQIIDWLNQHNINVVNAIVTVAILFFASIIILILSRFFNRWLTDLQGRLNLTDETNFIINRAITAVLWALTIFVVLDVWGIALGGVWAVVVSAITLIGVGFIATWAMISNFTASFFLVLWRPFHVGQIVEMLPENLKTCNRSKSNVHDAERRERQCAPDSQQLIFPENFQSEWQCAGRNSKPSRT
jgi:small-conductance mechanosensitive channel